MTSHDELSYYLSQGLAIRVDGITISDANLEHLNLILNEDDSYMKEYVNDQEGEIYAIEYQKIRSRKYSETCGISTIISPVAAYCVTKRTRPAIGHVSAAEPSISRDFARKCESFSNPLRSMYV